MLDSPVPALFLVPPERSKEQQEQLYINVPGVPQPVPVRSAVPPKRYHRKSKMFDWIGNLFNQAEPELDELDRRIAAADARIAEKQAYLEKLTADVEANKETVKNLEDTVGRLRKAVKQGEN